MRKSFVVIVVMMLMLVPFAAQAFTVPEEVQVTQPPAEQSVVQAAPAPTPTNDRTFKAVKSLDRKLVGKRGIVTSIRDKVGELFTAISGNKTAVNGARTAAENAETAAKSAKTAVEDLDKKLTDKKTGEFKKLKDTSWSVGAALSKDMAIYFGVTIALIVGLGVFVFFRTKGTNNLVKDVGNDVKKTPEESAKLAILAAPFPINLPGHNFEVTPLICGGKVRTLQIASGQTEMPNDVDNIARIPAKSSSNLKSTNAKILTAYINREFDGNDIQSKLQKAVVEKAIASDEVVEL